MTIKYHWHKVAFIIIGILCLLLFIHKKGLTKISPIRMTPFYQSPKDVVSSSPTCKYRRNLKRILLIVNFNSPHYANIPIIKAFYEPYFAKVVFCGSTKSDEFDVIAYPLGGRGDYSYLCVPRVAELYPPSEYEGYFFSNDDALLNVWNLNGDTDRIWLGTPIHKDSSVHRFGQPPPKDWNGWSLHNAQNCEKAFHEIEKLLNTSKAREFDLQKHFEYYYQNTKNSKICIHGWADAYYIPRRYAKIYNLLTDVYSHNKIGDEMAYPNIMLFLGVPSNTLQLHGMYFVDHRINKGDKTFKASYNFNLTFSHPFKLNIDENLRFLTHTVLSEMYQRDKKC